jgi:hypothetical protein
MMALREDLSVSAAVALAAGLASSASNSIFGHHWKADD